MRSSEFLGANGTAAAAVGILAAACWRPSAPPGLAQVDVVADPVGPGSRSEWFSSSPSAPGSSRCCRTSFFHARLPRRPPARRKPLAEQAARAGFGHGDPKQQTSNDFWGRSSSSG